MFSEGPPLTKTKPSSGPDPPERAKDSLRLVSFDPGKAGFALKLGDGKKTPASEQLRVTKISHEGQAYWRGVKRDWVIKEVNGDGIEKDSRTLTFSGTIKKRLKEAANCGKKYTVTFILPPEDAKHRARRRSRLGGFVFCGEPSIWGGLMKAEPDDEDGSPDDEDAVSEHSFGKSSKEGVAGGVRSGGSDGQFHIRGEGRGGKQGDRGRPRGSRRSGGGEWSVASAEVGDPEEEVLFPTFDPLPWPERHPSPLYHGSQLLSLKPPATSKAPLEKTL